MKRTSSLVTAAVLSGIVLALVVVASAGGLLIDGLYLDSKNVEAALRGGDLVNLAVVAPILAVALWRTWQGSVRGHLIWVAMLAYVFYGYAYYVFGPTFNDFFLLHVAIFSLSMVALGLGLGAFQSRQPALGVISTRMQRVMAGLLIVIAVFVVASYSIESLRYAGGGELPSDVLPFAEWRVHLGYVLDMTLLAPGAVMSGVLLWRGTQWGHVAATVMFIFLAVFQLNFLGAAISMNAADIPETAQAIPQAAATAILFAVPAAMLMRRVGPGGAAGPT